MHNSSSSRYKSKYSCGEVLNLRCWGLRSIVHVDGARRGPEPPGLINRGGNRAGNHLEQQSSPCALGKDNLPFPNPPSFRTSHPGVCRLPTPTTLFFSCSRLKSLQKKKKLHKNYNSYNSYIILRFVTPSSKMLCEICC